MSRTRPNSAERWFGNGISWLSLSAGPVMQSLFCTRTIHMLSCYANVVCPCVFHSSIASHRQREINDGSDIKRAALLCVTWPFSQVERAFWRLSLSVWSKCQSLQSVAYAYASTLSADRLPINSRFRVGNCVLFGVNYSNLQDQGFFMEIYSKDLEMR